MSRTFAHGIVTSHKNIFFCVGIVQHEAMEQFVANAQRYLSGKELENVVDKAAGY